MLLKDVRFLITQNPDRDILQNIDVRIEGSRIVEIGSNLSTDDTVLDCSDKIVMPGLVNTHTHAPMNVMRGISDNKVLQDWLEEDIFPAEEHMDDETIRYGTTHAIVEMLKTGTTCFNDMYAPEQPVADAVEDTGVRAVLSRGVIDINGEGENKLQESRDLLDRYTDHDRITPAVAPHAIYTCSEELLLQAKEQADKYDALLHTHLSETKTENDDCEREHDMTPTAYLHDLGLLDDRFIGAHAVWMTENDMQLLQKTGGGVAHNPCSNLKLGSGIADVPQLQAHDVTVGLATDSVASNNNLNLFEEAKFASLLQKRQDPRAMDEQRVLDMLTIDGAELLNLESEIGSVEEEKLADLITIDVHDITLTPRIGVRGPLSNLVFSFNGQVSDVFVHGNQLLENGEPTGINEHQVTDECQDLVRHFA